jgi:hypothetical protein
VSCGWDACRCNRAATELVKVGAPAGELRVGCVRVLLTNTSVWPVRVVTWMRRSDDMSSTAQ